jgi:hypothetical protein
VSLVIYLPLGVSNREVVDSSRLFKQLSQNSGPYMPGVRRPSYWLLPNPRPGPGAEEADLVLSVGKSLLDESGVCEEAVRIQSIILSLPVSLHGSCLEAEGIIGVVPIVALDAVRR